MMKFRESKYSLAKAKHSQIILDIVTLTLFCLATFT